MTKRAGVTEAERIATLESGNTSDDSRLDLLELHKRTIALLSADGAVPANVSGNYAITKAGVALLTLAAPASDGLEITIFSETANAHTLTATGLLQVGTVKTDVGTFGAFAGASCTLLSRNGKWNVIANNVVVYT